MRDMRMRRGNGDRGWSAMCKRKQECGAHSRNLKVTNYRNDLDLAVGAAEAEGK